MSTPLENIEDRLAKLTAATEAAQKATREANEAASALRAVRADVAAMERTAHERLDREAGAIFVKAVGDRMHALNEAFEERLKAEAVEVNRMRITVKEEIKAASYNIRVGFAAAFAEAYAANPGLPAELSGRVVKRLMAEDADVRRTFKNSYKRFGGQR